MSAGSNGREIFLPGVHSDIGGGYKDNISEGQIVFRDDRARQIVMHTLQVPQKTQKAIERDRNWLINLGWCTSKDLSVVKDGTAIRMVRRSISNAYSRIPLHLMIRLAMESGCGFDLRRLDQEHPIPQDLEKIKNIIDEKISSGEVQSSEDWLNDEGSEIKKIRMKYLHFSSKYGGTFGAHDPQWSDVDIEYRHRKKIIQNG